MLIENLNKEQGKAVIQKEGPILILAGAGSGKTKTLTHRVAYLISQHKVPAKNILAVTFTNKAAGEMKERIASLLENQNTSMPTIGTFHSVCARFLRHEIGALGISSSFSIYDEYDQLKMIKNIISDTDMDQKKINPRSALSLIENAKNDLVDYNHFKDFYESYISDEVGDIYARYQKNLKKNNALDFGDLIFYSVELLKKYPQILKRYQELFSYIMVDEYQDTNKAQYVFINMLAENHRNLCVVGDDWQSIYSWRGADIKNILSFEKDYPDALTVKLEQNYRSTSNILNGAHGVMEKAREKKDKKLWTEKGGGEKIKVYEARDEKDEARFVAKSIISSIDNGSKNSDFAVLYRTNAQSRALEEALMAYGIPYQIVGGVKFYERKEVKDVLAYLSLIVNPNNTVAMQRIINEPPRGIGEKTLEKIFKFAEEKNIDLITAVAELKNTNARTKSLYDFFVMISEIRNSAVKLSPVQIIELVESKTKYADYVKDGSEEGESRWENIQELKTLADKFSDKVGLDGVSNMLQEIALVTDLDHVDDKKNSVLLMTMHSAKGLEFKEVFIVGMEEGLFPHSRSIADPKEADEERRLCYVGMTRAREKLTIVHAKTRMLYGGIQMNPPSQFISDIDFSFKEYVNKNTDFDGIEYVDDDSHGGESGGSGILDRIMNKNW